MAINAIALTQEGLTEAQVRALLQESWMIERETIINAGGDMIPDIVIRQLIPKDTGIDPATWPAFVSIRVYDPDDKDRAWEIRMVAPTSIAALLRARMKTLSPARDAELPSGVWVEMPSGNLIEISEEDAVSLFIGKKFDLSGDEFRYILYLMVGKEDVITIYTIPPR